MQKDNKKIINQFAKLQDESISQEEMDNLSEWANKHYTNKALLDKMQDPDAYKKWLKELEIINKESAWMHINKVVKPQEKRKIYLTLLPYAATVLLALLLSSLVYYTVFYKHTIEQIAVESETIPTRKAELKLSNGNIVLLGSDVGRIKENDGSFINKDSLVVSYIADNNTIEKQTLINEINVLRGNEYQLQLSDGTKVWINSMSSVKFPVQFTGSTREVEINGEVYFEVKHNASKPFIVHTPEYDITVLGTAFNVSCYNDDATLHTTLLEGKVRIKHNNESKETIELVPDQQYVYDKTYHKGKLKNVYASDYVSWVNGYVQFEDETLGQIFRELERWYDIEVHFENEQLKSECYTGLLPRYEKVDIILNMMERVSNVNFEINDKKIIIK
ncbi:MAG: FecR family protein [Bacteroidota bacterium]